MITLWTPWTRPPPDEVADGVEVVRCPGEHLAGCVAVVERAREAQVGLVEQLAHSGLDPDADARRRVTAGEVDPQPDRREPDEDREVRPERMLVMDDRVVDRLLDQDRDRQRDGRVRERTGEPEQAEPPLVPPQPKQATAGRPGGVVRRVDSAGQRFSFQAKAGQRRCAVPSWVILFSALLRVGGGDARGNQIRLGRAHRVPPFSYQQPRTYQKGRSEPCSYDFVEAGSPTAQRGSW